LSWLPQVNGSKTVSIGGKFRTVTLIKHNGFGFNEPSIFCKDYIVLDFKCGKGGKGISTVFKIIISKMYSE